MSQNSELIYSNYTETEINSQAFVYTWKIINFAVLSPSEQNPLTSQPFSDDEKSMWTIKIYKFENSYLYDSIRKRNYTGYRYALEVKFNNNVISPLNKIHGCYLTAHIINNKGKEYEVYHKHIEEAEVKFPFRTYTKIEDDILNPSLGLLTNNNLTLRFKMFIATGEITNRPQPLFLDSMNDKTSPLIELTSILNNPKFSDVKIVIGDKEIHAYKGILATQSPVFAAMFEHEMKESTENVIEVTDIDYNVMQEVLRFIYSGKVNNIKSTAKEILAAADKYEIEELKRQCEQVLISDLKVETVCDLLIHAEKYGAEILKKHALEFFKLYAKEIIETEKYKAEINNLLPLFSEILHLLAS